MNIWKVMIEQGDPYFVTVTTTQNLRCAVGSFLLVGIILSNAYKSENVYNIIKLRGSIPYERFEELLADNFTIYTRSSYIVYETHQIFDNYDKKSKTFSPLYDFSPHHIGRSINLDHLLAIYSEIYEWKKASEQNFTSVYDLLLENTKLIGASVLQKIVANFSRLHFEKPEYEGKLSWYMMEKEDEILENLLTKCDRVSIIAQEQDANEMGRKLQGNDLKHVYVGKETYANVSITIEIVGWIEPEFLKRLKIIKESGLWDWWPRWNQENKRFNIEKYSNVEKDAAPNMTGNILLIFLVLLIGLGISLLLFLFETLNIVVKIIQKAAKRALEYVNLVIKQLFKKYSLCPKSNYR